MNPLLYFLSFPYFYSIYMDMTYIHAWQIFHAGHVNYHYLVLLEGPNKHIMLNNHSRSVSMNSRLREIQEKGQKPAINLKGATGLKNWQTAPEKAIMESQCLVRILLFPSFIRGRLSGPDFRKNSPVIRAQLFLLYGRLNSWKEDHFRVI